MDIDFIKKTKDEIEFNLEKEDISFFNLIVELGYSKRDVDFISVKKADNLEDKFTFYLKAKNNPAKDVLKELIQEAQESVEQIIGQLETSIKKEE